MSQPHRPARPDEMTALTGLALRSKAYWGYDNSFMSNCEAALTFTPELVAKSTVIEVDGVLVAVITLSPNPEYNALEAEFLFVEPTHIGRGYGRILWGHALEVARAGNYPYLIAVADPHAQIFYERMGALMIKRVPSECAPSRLLPLMRVRVR
jgi:GNAT superfamily N-acetyltransferase